MTNIITACFDAACYASTRPAWLIDHGMVLKIAGVELPEAYEVDFSNSKTEEATRVLGGPDGVVIPDQYFLSKAPQIYAWVYLTTGDSGFTTLQITIPLSQRPDVSTEPPTPQETSLIEQAIAALNDGVERAETAADDAEASVANIQQTVDDALQAAKDSGEFDGADGVNGVTFTPDVDAAGNISWTNDGGLPNPQTRNIKGPAGKDGEVGATPNLTIGTVETLEPGEDATAEITGTAENPVLNLGIPQGEQGEGADTSNLAPVIINSASGDIASFTDGADGLPVKALSVNVEPIQDLHGQASPYPAGGGVNLLDPAKCSAFEPSATYGLTVTHDQATAIWTISGTPTLQSASLGFNFCTYSDFSLSGKGYQVQAFPISGTPIKNVYGFRTEAENKIAIIINTVANPTVNMTFKVSVAATSQTAWSPYSNICPISGRTSATVTRTGKNLLKLSDWETESDSGITIGTDNISIINKGYQETLNRYNVLNRSACVFSFHVKTVSLTDSRTSFAVYADETTKLTGSGTWATENITLDSVGTEKDIVLTVPNGTEYISFGGWAWSGEVQISNLQLELGSTASAYEPYAGNTYTIQLGDTVYGGTLDVTAGKMVVDRAIVDLGTLRFSLWNSTSARDCYSVTFTDIKPQSSNYENINALSTIFVATNYNASWKPWQMSFTNTSKQVTFIVPHGEYATPVDFAAAMSGVMFCYELAQPIEITLTPTQIETLIGTNNIWSDAGDVSVDYRADTKLYIDNIHQPTDDDMTADAQIASDKYFLIGGTLYKATTVIPAGDTIRPGTNCVKTNLAEALNALNA